MLFGQPTTQNMVRLTWVVYMTAVLYTPKMHYNGVCFYIRIKLATFIWFCKVLCDHYVNINAQVKISVLLRVSINVFNTQILSWERHHKDWVQHNGKWGIVMIIITIIYV